MKPDEIYKAFINRINKTNMLYDSLPKDSSTIEMHNTIYFKYYFDISTSIEAVIRGITSTKGKDNTYIEYLAKPSDESIAYFKKYDEIKALCQLDNLFKELNSNYFKDNYQDKVSILRVNSSISLSFKNDGSFIDIYNKVRKTRNTLAHGLMANDVDYDDETLKLFLYVLYILLNYYKSIFK